MEKESMVALICLGFFTMIVLSIYFIMKYKTMIQPQSFDPNFKREKRDWQKPGIVVLGVGVGVLIVGVLNDNRFYTDNDAVNIGIIVVSTGISMIVANYLDRKSKLD